MKVQKGMAMGIGRESADKDMLRGDLPWKIPKELEPGNGYRNDLSFYADNMRATGDETAVQLSDEYPPEPSPSPMPAPPPREEDMDAYNEDLRGFYDKFDAWKKEVAAIDSAKKTKRDAMNRELYSLSDNVDDPKSTYIIDNVIKNSETVSSEMINVDYEAQKRFKEETDSWEKQAQDIFNIYVTTGSLASLGLGGAGGAATGALMAALGYIFSDSVSDEAPIIKEGNYKMYRTDYFEPYGFLGWGGQNHHSVLILAEVDEKGNPVDSNHTYVFDSYMNIPNLNPTSNDSLYSGDGLPTTNNFFYEYGE